jgi:hypothetical protein
LFRLCVFVQKGADGALYQVWSCVHFLRFMRDTKVFPGYRFLRVRFINGGPFRHYCNASSGYR